MELLYSAAKAVFFPGLHRGLRWTIEGAHLIPPHGPVLLAANHVSYLDPLALAYLGDRRGRRIRFLAKRELFEKPGLGTALRAIHQIPVDRGRAAAAGALDAAVAALGAGECVVVFPEGTISTDLDPMAGKSGTARLARAAGVAVTPVGLWGAHRILTKGRPPDWRWGIPQVAVVGPALRLGPDEHTKAATDRIMVAIGTAVGRARELYPQRPAPGEDAWWWRPGSAPPLRSCRDRPEEQAAADTADTDGADSAGADSVAIDDASGSVPG